MKKTMIACIVLLFFMLGMSFAAVPLYNLFCKVTGYGGTPKIALENASKQSTRKIKVSFDTNIRDGLPWKFYPENSQIELYLGETKTVNFTIESLGQDMVGIAAFNITPEQGAPYFNKLQCFCFEDILIRAGEKKILPMAFYVDPEILSSPDSANINEITLSYTYFLSKKSIAEIEALELNKSQKTN